MYSITDRERIMDPMTTALITAAIGGGGSIGSSLLSKNPKETKTQKQKRKLVDDLIASLSGGGSFSDLFEMDEGAFQKSFVDPAKARFKGQIAPQIQQSFIAGGQQRGTGLDDTLTRAGVDMDQLLNEQFMNFQQGAQNRKANAFGQIFGAGDGVPDPFSTGDKLQQGVGGFLGSDQFSDSIENILKAYSSSSAGNTGPKPPREGFAS